VIALGLSFQDSKTIWPCTQLELLGLELDSVTMEAHFSEEKLIGGVFKKFWLSSQMPCHFCSRDIHFKELYAIIQAILHWGDHWGNHHITSYCDNQNEVSWLSSGTSRSRDSMPLSRRSGCSLLAYIFLFPCLDAF